MELSRLTTTLTTGEMVCAFSQRSLHWYVAESLATEETTAQSEVLKLQERAEGTRAAIDTTSSSSYGISCPLDLAADDADDWASSPRCDAESDMLAEMRRLSVTLDHITDSRSA